MSGKIVRLRQAKIVRNATSRSEGRRANDAYRVREHLTEAEMDKVLYTGPPPRVIKNPTAQGAGNAVILSAYTFLPKKYLSAGKLPLLVLVHGGIHGNFDSRYIHIVRELLQQGYAVLAPEYRGSSGYGKEFWQLIDYGGLEVEDVFAGKQTPALRQALNDVLNEARSHLDAAYALLGSVAPDVRPAFLSLAQVKRDLAMLMRADHNPFVIRPLSRFKTLWTLWWASHSRAFAR